MPPKKAIALGDALAPLDITQEGLPLRGPETRKRKAINPTPHEEELDQEIRELEAIHQQVERRREKMFRQESPSYDDAWYDDFNHGNFAFDDASP
jgi:hypothetical protein